MSRGMSETHFFSTVTVYACMGDTVLCTLPYYAKTSQNDLLLLHCAVIARIVDSTAESVYPEIVQHSKHFALSRHSIRCPLLNDTKVVTRTIPRKAEFFQNSYLWALLKNTVVVWFLRT